MSENMDAIVGFAALAILVLGVIGLIKPSSLGFSSRKKSTLVFFGLFLLLAVVAAMFDDSTEDAPVKSTQVSQKTTTVNIVQEKSVPVVYKEIRPMVREFASMTDLNKDSWSENNEWKHHVQGRCEISEVEKTGLFSEIKGAAFEVDCELSGEFRAVLFFDKKDQQVVSAFRKGQVIHFKGHLKNIQTPLWTSAYVKVTSFQ